MTAGGDAPALAVRGRVLSFDDDPETAGEAAYTYLEDGAVLIEGGTITAVVDAADIPAGIGVDHYPGHLVTAGFIDAHVHYPQLGVIASYGGKLIDWLNNYTFPEESRFADRGVAAAAAKLFFDELVRNGFTTSAVYCTTHPQSVDACFEEAARRGLRTVAGKVLMDRHAPDELLDTPQEAYDHSKALIGKWHGVGRSLYGITPRFAPTSSPEQLEAAGALYAEHEGVYVQSHVSEDVREIEWVAQLFPEAASYLDVYDRFGLLGERALFGHGIHFSDAETARAAETGTTVVHCPTSNLFLGSGLFEFRKLKRAGVPVALGTDVGGGTSMSPFATMKAAYEIARFHDDAVSPFECFYLATLGGARALHLGDRIGRLAPGYEADVTVIDPASTDLIAHRAGRAETLEELLFAQIVLADDRAVRATYANGAKVYERDG